MSYERKYLIIHTEQKQKGKKIIVNYIVFFLLAVSLAQEQ